MEKKAEHYYLLNAFLKKGDLYDKNSNGGIYMLGNIIAAILGIIAFSAVVFSCWYDNRNTEDKKASDAESEKDAE